MVLDVLTARYLFLQLSFYGLTEAFLPATAKYIVLDQLLGDGTSAAYGGISGDDAFDHTGDGTEVDTVMSPEAGVFDGNEGIDQILRKLIKCGPDHGWNLRLLKCRLNCLPWSYTVVAKPWGTMLSMLISGELSMMPLYMPTPMLTPTTASIKKIEQHSGKAKKKRLAILRFGRGIS